MKMRHLVSTWALVCVAVATAALIFFAYDKTEHLSAPDWCARAGWAAKQGDRPESAIQGCFGLMSKQIDALAIDSHIAHGTIALALLVLVVIVLAGGRLSFRGGKDGVDLNISRNEAAERVADAADEEADRIKGG
ncbi:hypothetical protein [Qipengyuania huizhouensis]|uniref:hypothetical protein n=1 Tax=Qipengyuania huizhouensis TaxID=2867245 RepID=UPI001C87A4B2|nr:hypothetical protein [Qipengyuania huizhouensis]MBX7459569.1 hypothetical protein [Qipengyuania huizhouensis]